MTTQIAISIAQQSDKKKETAKLSLHFDRQTTPVVVDVNGASLLKVSRLVPDVAQDFLSIAACVYAADKALARSATADKWTREIAIEIPVEHVGTWSRVAHDLSETVSFLTGDTWTISFRKGEKRLIQKRARTRIVRTPRLSASAVCLFSGGLDSYIGAIDWLSGKSTERLLLVGHYDRHVAGPGKDQRELRATLAQAFPDRFALAQTQVGLATGGADTNFRSRSLLFIALGCYFAELLGPSAPILIPENGPIAINFPLTPARRGSCSTRTVHPYFIVSLNSILREVGITNPVVNPYALKTKGEMVTECRNQSLLRSTAEKTRSCAKLNHREYWTNKTARACGKCIPCLFRRASLFSSGLDVELYGDHVETISTGADLPADLLAMLTFIRKQHSDREIAAELLGNGRLPLGDLYSYIDLVKRMRAEVLTWLRSKGSAYLQAQLHSC